MGTSILTDTKKVLGIGEDDTSFDLDVLMHINSVFSTLEQLGVGPVSGFMIEDSGATWEDYLGLDKRLNVVKSYIYLRVRLLFDPPTTSYTIAAFKEQVSEMEWRMNVTREGDMWIPPIEVRNPVGLLIDGGDASGR